MKPTRPCGKMTRGDGGLKVRCQNPITREEKACPACEGDQEWARMRRGEKPRAEIEVTPERP